MRLLLALLLAVSVSADQGRPRLQPAVGVAVYWVDDNGAAANWSDCLSVNALSGVSACSLAKANSSATQGHFIYLRAGTYNTNIQPTSSGTLNNRITYSGYQSETATITNVGATGCIQLNNMDYIVITKLTITNCDQLANITGGSSYNEISYNTISVGAGAANVGINVYTLGATALTANTHNWFHHNLIYHGGYIDEASVKNPCNDISGMMAIGADEDSDSFSDYNTVEDNTIYWGAHHALKFNTHFNVARNNVMHNEGWLEASAFCQSQTPTELHCAPDGYYGNRVMNILFNHTLAASNDTYNLIEGNRIGFAGLPSDGNGADVLTMGGQRDIARYNDIYNGLGLGFYARTSGNYANNLQVYNNTLAFNGTGPACRLAAGGFLIGAVRFQNGGSGNLFTNNIVNSTTGTEIRPGTGNTIADNWLAADGNPQFTNTTNTDPFSTTQPDFTLQSGSGAIDTGVKLTDAVGAGSSITTLVVANALPFQYGNRGSDLVRNAGTMHADWIAIGTVSNTVQISSIDYATNTITLANAKSWSDGADVWLYKKSDGVVVLVGSAPDKGAHEKP